MFSKKSIAQPIRTGDRLRALREAAGISVDELAELSKLQADTIRAMEVNAFHYLPAEPVYQKLYIKRYATVFGVDASEYVSQFVAEELKADKPTPTKTTKAKESRWLKARPAMISVAGGVAVLAFFFVYLGNQLSNLYAPPRLELTTPTEGEINESGITTINGLTDPEVSVFINGQQVRSGEDGSFATDVDLQPGVNTILVSARKRHGTESNVTKYVMYRETSQVSMQGTPQLTTN